MRTASKFPKRLRRTESFFGIHFDFHARIDCKHIGQHTTRKMIQTIIDLTHPDYIQCDSKGHPGISSYPTRVGYPAPQIAGDPLRLWRTVTARAGVALYVHYSGIWDDEILKRHPTWGRINADKKPDTRAVSLWSPYIDRILIPQLKELNDVYGIDGAWIDGDCWAAACDYTSRALADFKKQTGIKHIPRKLGDPYFLELAEFSRAAFRRYVKQYVNALHAHNPEFQITSNWSFSALMPEPPSIPVDFLSGDYSFSDSINSARLQGRYLAQQGQPWDLMAWSFNGKFEDRSWTTKSIPQLQQEAAVVLSLGGGFQAYFSQKRDGSISLWQMNLMSEVAKFCRARQKYCHKAQPVPQIGLLFSTDALYRRSDRLFGPWTPQTDIVTGILQCLLESQNSVDLLSEHHLATRLRDYPLIVIPQWDYLKPAILSELRRYVERGGNLLLIGHQSASLFAAQLDVKFKIDTTDKLQWLEHEAWLACIKTRCSALKLGKTAKPFGKLYAQNDFVGPHQPPASITRLGKGKIAAIYFNLGEQYRIGANAVTRAFLQSIVRELFAAPMVEVTGSRYVDVAVNKINGKLAINLVNTAGPHADARVLVFDEIPPVGPLQISIRSDRKPARVTLRPEGKSLKFLYTKGKILLTLPILHIHSVIVIE